QRVINHNNTHGTSYALTDPQVSKIVGPVWARKFQEIVRSNPSLMQKGLSANFVFDKMGDKFSHRVMPITTKIQAVFDRAGSITELCLDPVKAQNIADIPTAMPRYEAAYRTYALALGFNAYKQKEPTLSSNAMEETPAPKIPIPTR